MDHVTRIVQLAAYGDIFAALPIAKALADRGGRVQWVVQEKFANVLEGATYVDPIAWPGHRKDLAGAVEFARRQEPADAEVLVIQVDRNTEPAPGPCRDYLHEPWVRAGMGEQFGRLPLALDGRDPVREAGLIDRVLFRDGRPNMLLNTRSNSSPYPDRAGLARWARETFGRFNVVDISDLRAARVYDVLGLMERSAVLLSVDTCSLHLSNACGIPTVGLVNDCPYLSTPARGHWIARVPYEASLTYDGRRHIERHVLHTLSPRRVG